MSVLHHSPPNVSCDTCASCYCRLKTIIIKDSVKDSDSERLCCAAHLPVSCQPKLTVLTAVQLLQCCTASQLYCCNVVLQLGAAVAGIHIVLACCGVEAASMANVLLCVPCASLAGMF
jgi:hypothetical protein